MTAHSRKIFQRLIMLALIIAIASPLAACGRKASPESPEGSGYPGTYPSKKKPLK